MNDAAYRRARRQAVGHLLRATLRSDDTPEQRADNLLAMIGVRWCDDHPQHRAEVRQAMVDVLSDYALLDKVASGARLPAGAYDGQADSFRSYEAAIAAIRREKGGV